MVFLLSVVTIINLAFWLLLFVKFSFQKQAGILPIKDKKQKEILLVIAARNEAENLGKNLPLILSQDYPNYKVLIIDDHSEDNSPEILEAFSRKYNKLIVQRNEVHLGKKRSLQAVLSSVSSNQLVFTDADCMPNSKKWLQHISNAFTAEKRIVLGYGPYARKPGLLNLFIRFESFMTALQYFSYALMGIPYMGVGRNLAYNKSVFDSVDGFTAHLDKLSGDDDLFISQVANAKNVAIQIHPESFMFSPAPDSWSRYIHQKKRHLSTSVRYKLIHQVLLSIYAGSHILFYLLLFFAGYKAALLLWFFRYLLIILSSNKGFRKLGEGELLFYFPILDLMMFFYYIFMSVYSLWPGKIKW